MGYLKAAVLGVIAGVATGAAGGAYGVLGAGHLSPADTAAVYSRAVSEALNCAAILTMVLVPVVAFVLLRNRRARRA